ncbi:hypothetical protein HRbin17_01136 [bacterium HR17]|uniref:Thiol-disulfide oxidoreductase ResA n=1 Tax=Candidatus Fervidibacter japonicus TaxID=2035412 RepID=A0A2H5XBR1_9BACT|nr:hypothetical protein HRbin17_01136 [bacterium HR17]
MLVISLVFATSAIAHADPVTALSALKGRVIDNLVLRDLRGKSYPFSQWRGKVVVMNFWSPG